MAKSYAISILNPFTQQIEEEGPTFHTLQQVADFLDTDKETVRHILNGQHQYLDSEYLNVKITSVWHNGFEDEKIV